MRYVLILLLFFISLQADEKKQTLTMGLGIYEQTQPYKDVDTIVLPTPVVFYDNGIVYARWSRVGLYFFGDKQDEYAWGFSITAQPRTYGYKSSDSTYLNGLDEKKTTWEGGLAFSATVDKAYIEMMVLTDMLDRYESWIVKTEIGYDFKIGSFSFYPSAIFIYQSSEFLDYYYGVSKKEALSSVYTQYSAKNGFQVGLQTYIKYPFTDKVSALINLRADRLSDEATNSPIVHDDYIYSGMASLIYSFTY